MPDHPYKALPPQAFWRRAVAEPVAAEVDPVTGFGLRITRQTKVATAGSCFAQHIARHLREHGFNYLVTEPAHPIVPEAVATRNNYGVFTARFGNIYTTRQLLQLLLRAYGRFTPADDVWLDGDGAVIDPFRPGVQPGGFLNEAEMRRDRAQHLACVRRMFETADVFVFTLGLTECWRSRADGAVFPVCPGVGAGTFDPGRHAFFNETVEDVAGDLEAFLAELREINPGVEVVLTVSPVPLAATAAPDAHVLAATTYSKAVLRVAAETARRRHGFVHYFPAYEIVSGAFSRGQYYADDLRNVTEAGVEHVMRLFLRHATDAAEREAGAAAREAEPGEAARVGALSKAWVETMCDEAALDG
jgi:hypothetical protein